MEKKLIYAIDDEQSIREIYEYALKNAGYEVKTLSGSKELFEQLAIAVPDLIILDIMLEGQDGYAILQILKSKLNTQNIPIIMVSAKTTEIDKVKGLDLGADDYIAKPFGIMELVARINAKLRNIKPNKRVFSYKDVFVDDDKHTVIIEKKEVQLTLKQYELLKLLVINAEKVVERDVLLDKVWGENYGETRTLDIHIGDLRKMLCDSAAEIVTVRGVGYMLK